MSRKAYVLFVYITCTIAVMIECTTHRLWDKHRRSIPSRLAHRCFLREAIRQRRLQFYGTRLILAIADDSSLVLPYLI